MADNRHDYENPSQDKVAQTTGAAGHQSTDQAQGMRGGTQRASERGRDEFQGNGESAALDEGRAEQAGRHYGRSGPEEPGRGYGRGPLQPAEGTTARAENDGIAEDELRRPDGGEVPARSQGVHGPTYAQGRDAGQRKQMLPSDGGRKRTK